MKSSTVTEFRQNIKAHLKKIEDDQDILILSGPKKKSFVIMTLEQYESMEETSYLLSSPANAQRLMEGMRQAEQGKVIIKDLKL